MSENISHGRPFLVGWIDRHFNWFLSVVVVAVGFVFLLVAASTPKESVWHELSRDVGISLLIAAVVSVTYESFARSRFIRHTMEAMLSEIFGNIVHPDVWKVVKDGVIRHQIIREALDIHVELLPAFGPRPGPMVIWLRISYDLRGLHDSPGSKPLPLRHFLDDHIPKDGYPRFDSIVIDKEEQNLERVTGGAFETMVDLPHRDGRPVKVASDRKEVTYVPGSYYLTMTELTKGIRSIHLTGLPDNVEASVGISAYKGRVLLRKNIPLDEEFKDTVLLPGHSLEFRFKLKDESSGAGTPDAGGVL